MYQHLSPQTLYLRFCSAGVNISGELEAKRLCGGHPEAQGVVLALSEGEVIGIGEFVRMDDEMAEIAFLVRDDCQGEGIGTALAEQLVEVARETGFAKLHAYLMWENYGMRRLLAKMPYPRSTDGGYGALCVTLDIGHVVPAAK